MVPKELKQSNCVSPWAIEDLDFLVLIPVLLWSILGGLWQLGNGVDSNRDHA